MKSTTIKYLFSKRKQHLKILEKQEANQFKEYYQTTSTSHSLITDLFHLLKWKTLSLGLSLFSLFIGYQIYDTIDVTYTNGQLIILPLKQKYESKLADSAISMILIEESIIQDCSLQKLVQPFKLILIDRNYPIFQLFPNNTLLSNKSFLQSLTKIQYEKLIEMAQHHNEQRTYCHNLDLTYIPTLTQYKLQQFPNRQSHKSFQGAVLAKEYFFLQPTKEQEIQDPILTELFDKYRSQPFQGKYSLIDQHPYI